LNSVKRAGDVIIVAPEAERLQSGMLLISTYRLRPTLIAVDYKMNAYIVLRFNVHFNVFSQCYLLCLSCL